VPTRGAALEALSRRIGHADVAFTMKQYVQTDLCLYRDSRRDGRREKHGREHAPRTNHMPEALSLFEKGPLALVAGPPVRRAFRGSRVSLPQPRRPDWLRVARIPCGSGGQQVRLTVWFAGGRGWSCPAE
jgi:hypothetical protein